MAAKRLSEEQIQVTVSTYRWGFIGAGAAAAIVGLLILLWPNVMGTIFSSLIGAYALVTGVIFGWIAVRGVEASILLRVARGLVGLALIVGGILMFIFSSTARAVIVDVVGVALGIMWLFEAGMTFIIMRGKTLKGWMVAYLIVAVIVGILLLFTPVWGGWPVQWLFGLGLLGLGVAQAVRGLTAPAIVIDLETQD